jgi:hypothetical protein
MSSDSSVNDALAGYSAGRVTAEQLVGVVAAAYYRETRAEKRDALRPLMEVIERAHPGFVALFGSVDTPGFAVRVAERPFPRRNEPELRQAVQAVLAMEIVTVQPVAPSLFSRILRAIRQVFSA